MTLVAVVDVLLDTEFLQQQHTTNTEQDLLLQAVLPVAAVEGVRDGLVELRVELVVGVEQIKLHTAHVDTPHVCVNIIVCVRHIDDERIAVLIELALNGQGVEVLRLVVGNLLAVHREALGEVSKTIHETYGTHVDIRVGGLFHIVAGKHAQTARIDF